MAWNLFGGNKKPTANATPAVEVKPAGTVSGPVRFACKILAEVAKQRPGENIFISPASIGFALTMTSNGASGETREGMAQALELQGLSVEDVNAGAKIVKALLERREPTVELAIANSLWSNRGFAFKPEFIAIAREIFAAEARELDFSAPESLSAINGWVKEKTRGKIGSVIGSLRGVVMLLINAIYFKGDWAEGFAFKKEATAERTFRGLKGKSTVSMMTQSRHFSYVENNKVQCIKLPYGEGNVSMIVMLPRAGVDFGQFCGTLDAGQWEGWIGAMSGREGKLMLPRFKLEFEMELSDVLKPLGMERAFDGERAEFGPMCEKPVVISQVIHKTFVDVNEVGTEAVAVTAVVMSRAGRPAPAEAPFEMIVDRPFVCAIRDERTGVLLFLGAIVKP